MKVLVCGSTGFVGRAVAAALKARGHRVLGASRSGPLRIDFMAPVGAPAWAERLRELQVDAVVNCVGILMARGARSFERVHAAGPAELFEGAAQAGISRVVQVSALGADTGESPYLRSKRSADEALLALPLAGTVLRPSLLYGPGCPSTALFATLAALPVVALPGGGTMPLQPLHVYELAEIVVRCLEREQPARGAFELGGAAALSYREMLSTFRAAQRLGDALWMPLPLALMRLAGWCAEALPQSVFCRETVALLACGKLPAHNAAAALLGRAPSALATGLAISPPMPWLSLRAELSPALAWALRGSLAAMWLWTAAISLALPQRSGVLELLARCGFAGDAGLVALVASCTLNTALGLAVLLHPGPRVHALQAAAIVGYTLTAAFHMPELTLDHCGPLVKNLPLLAAVAVLWMAAPASGGATSHERRSERLNHA